MAKKLPKTVAEHEADCWNCSIKSLAAWIAHTSTNKYCSIPGPGQMSRERHKNRHTALHALELACRILYLRIRHAGPKETDENLREAKTEWYKYKTEYRKKEKPKL